MTKGAPSIEEWMIKQRCHRWGNFMEIWWFWEKFINSWKIIQKLEKGMSPKSEVCKEVRREISPWATFFIFLILFFIFFNFFILFFYYFIFFIFIFFSLNYVLRLISLEEPDSLCLQKLHLFNIFIRHMPLKNWICY